MTLQSASGTITPAALTITATSDSKVYDGTTTSGQTPAESGLITVSGDTLSGLSQAFTSKDVLGTGGSTLTVEAGYTVNDGNGGSDYAVTLQSASGTITPAALTITATSDSKVYDGTTTSGQTPAESGLITAAGDTLSGLSQAFTSKDVLGTGGSTLTVEAGYTVNDGNGGADYTVTLQSATGTITPAALTITATSDSKVYDGTTTSGQTPAESGLIMAAGDTLSGLSQAFTSKDVLGTGGSTLTVEAGYTVNDGNGGADYAVTLQSATGTITPAALTITATSDSKVYDGTTTSGQTPAESGLITVSGDTLSGLSQAFTSKDVLGTGGSTLTVEAGYTVNDGNGGSDYTVTLQSAAGTITPAALTITATSDSKVYDGTTTSGQTPAESGLITVSGDTLNGLSQAFTSKDVLGTNGSTLVVEASYTVNDGNGGADYAVTLQSAAGTITPAALTITATSDSKVYDGTTTSGQTPAESGLITATGDTLSGLSQAFTSKDVLGTGSSTLTVEAGYTVNDGNGGADYTVTLQSATGTITPAALTITATSDSKVYDGTTTSGQTPAESGLITVSGDTLSGLSQAFTSKDVLGTGGSTLTVEAGYTVNDGNGGSDYAVTLQSASGTITPAALTITATSDSKVYDGTTTSGQTPAESGLITVSGDTLTGLSQSFTSKDVLGTGSSTLTVGTGYTVNDGNGGSDYAVTLETAAGTITSAALSYTIGNDSHPEGSTDDLVNDLGSTIDTGINGENLNIAYSSDGNTVAAVVNTYDITGVVSDGTGLASDYDVLLTPGTMTVTLAASKVVMQPTQLSSVTAGTTLTSITVYVEDPFGNIVTGDDSMVTVALPHGVFASGTTSVAATNGVATFTDLVIDTAGTYTLKATDGTLTSATSSNFTVSAAGVNKVEFSPAQPGNGKAGSALTSVTVHVEDQYGNLVNSANSMVTVALPGGSFASGTKSVAAIHGVANFTNLVINMAGTYTLQATDGILASGTSDSFTVSPAVPKKLAFNPVQPANGAVKAPLSGNSVFVEDQYGNIVTSDNSMVKVALTSGSFDPSSTVSVAAKNGVVNFTNLLIDTAGIYTLKATDGAMTSGSSHSFTVVGAPAKLVFNPAKPGNVTAGSALTSVTVDVEDSLGHVVTGDNSTVTVALTSGSFTSGTTSVAATNGVAMFTDLVLDTAGTYTLKATDGTLSSAASSKFTVSPAVANQLVFNPQQPANGTAGAVLSSVKVDVEDQYGNVVTGNSSSVTVAVSPGSFASVSTTKVAASKGVATFGHLIIYTVGTYTLTATDGTLASAFSGSFTVSPASANKLVFSPQAPGNGTAGTAIATMTVNVEDQFGNIVTGNGSTVTMSLSRKSFAAGSTTSLAATQGVASFSNLTINSAGTYTLTAKDGTLGSATSGKFTISPTTASMLVFNPQGPANIKAGKTLATVTVDVEDQYGNVVTGDNSLVAVGVAGGTFAGGTPSVAAVSGVAKFTDLTIDTAGTYSLTATALNRSAQSRASSR